MTKKFKLGTIWVLLSFLLVTALTLVTTPPSATATNETVGVWLTTANRSSQLSPQANLTFAADSGTTPLTINVDESQTYQTIDGFGASFSDSSAELVNQLSTSSRQTLMNNLFDPNQGIGLSFLRQPMGASDFSSIGNYSYDDGAADPSLFRFSISHDQSYIIPILKQAIAINPNVKIMATPWSPPGWMKSSGSMIGGTLNTSAYAAYANYFVKFIQAYAAQGVPIYALSMQNEPLYSPTGYPGMSFPATDQENFLKNNLGPTFASNNIKTKVLVYDHNWDQPGYPATVLGDPAAAQYATGTAYHCYGGDVSGQTTTHNQFPNKDIYFTECSGGTWQANPFQEQMELIINGSRNWAKSVVLWNMALDPNGGPTNGGCTTCRGVVTIDPNSGSVTYNIDYYTLGHASKFVTQGASRIDSTTFGSGSVEDVAFKNPDGSKALIAYNSSSASQTFKVRWGNEAFTYTLPAGAAATFKWSGTPATNGAYLSRAGWSASASASNSGEPASNMLDSDTSTRWSSGAGQTNGQSFQVDLGSTQTFSGLNLDTGSASTGDYPVGYQVFVSANGSSWGSAIATGAGTGQQTRITFATQTARYVKVVETGSSGSWWSIAEFNVLGSSSTSPTPTATATPKPTATPIPGATPTPTVKPTVVPTATPKPTATPTPSGSAPAWVVNHAYAIGDLVTYQGLVYKCIQAHTSQVDWQPPNVPALWQQQ